MTHIKRIPDSGHPEQKILVYLGDEAKPNGYGIEYPISHFTFRKTETQKDITIKYNGKIRMVYDKDKSELAVRDEDGNIGNSVTSFDELFDPIATVFLPIPNDAWHYTGKDGLYRVACFYSFDLLGVSKIRKLHAGDVLRHLL